MSFIHSKPNFKPKFQLQIPAYIFHGAELNEQWFPT